MADVKISGSNNLWLLVGRILIGLLFLVAAYNKIKGYGGTTGYFGRLGVPMPAVVTPLVIAFELAAGVLLIIGYQTRMVAFALAAFVVVAALLAHMNFADANQLNHFLKNLAVGGGCLALFVSGPGSYSVDAGRG